MLNSNSFPDNYNDVMKWSIYASIQDCYEQIEAMNSLPKQVSQDKEYIFQKDEIYDILSGNVDMEVEENTSIEEVKQFSDTALTCFEDLSTLSQWNIDALLYFIRNPDEGSDFAKQLATIHVSILEDDNRLLNLLFQVGYAIQAKLDIQGNIVSFVAYQKDKEINLLKVFKLHTNEEYRGQRLTAKIVEELLQNHKGMNVKVGKWPNETNEVNEHSERMIEIYEENGYHVDKENFIIFNRYQ